MGIGDGGSGDGERLWAIGYGIGDRAIALSAMGEGRSGDGRWLWAMGPRGFAGAAYGLSTHGLSGFRGTKLDTLNSKL
jgi:hypothetical protein